MTTNAPAWEMLLAERGWLLKLARGLARDRDRDDAEDAGQETFLAAVRRAPSPERPPRPWLAEVASNFVRNRARESRRRRERHERAAVTDDSSPSPESLLVELELQKRVADALLALDEPFRTTVGWRYLHDLSAAEIGRRLGVPAGTVRWRLKVGLERLRAALDETYGGRERWLLAVMPLVHVGRRPLRWAFAAAALAVVGGGWICVSRTTVASAPSRAFAALGAPAPIEAPPHFTAASRDGDDCHTENERIAAELSAIEPRLLEVAEPRTLHRLGQANRRAEEGLRPLVDEAFQTPENADLGFVLGCRSASCRISILEPIEARPPRPPWALPAKARIGKKMGRSSLVLGTPVRDVVSGRLLRERSIYFTLEPALRLPLGDGAPVEVRGAGCASRRSALEDRRAIVLRALERDLSPDRRFEMSAPAPERSRALAAAIVRALERDDVEAVCRGDVCKVSLPDDPGRSPSWLQTLDGAAVPGMRLRGYAASDKGVFLVFQDAARTDGLMVVTRLRNDVLSSDGFRACGALPPARGRLVGRLMLAEAGEWNDDDETEAISVRLVGEGEVDGSPLAKCAIASFRDAMAKAPLKGNPTSGVVGLDVTFPLPLAKL